MKLETISPTQPTESQLRVLRLVVSRVSEFYLNHSIMYAPDVVHQLLSVATM